MYVIDAHTMAIIGKIAVGQRAWYLSFTPDESRLYVACGRSDSVSVIDVAAAKVIANCPRRKDAIRCRYPKMMSSHHP